MNNKGFTLVELLAVVVILALLALLTTTSVTKLVKDAKEDLSSTQIQLIKSAAEAWGADNLNMLPSTGECSYLTLKDLKSYGLLDNTIIDPKDNQEISDDLKIKISTTTSDYGKIVTNYEVNSKNTTNCEEIYPTICSAVKETTLGNVPEGNFEFGDKYKCNVGDGVDRYFYLLEDGDNTTLVNGDTGTTDKGEVSLIMDRNYGTTTAWNINDDGEKGPITALETLEEETKNWKVKVNLPTTFQLAVASGNTGWNYDKELSHEIVDTTQYKLSDSMLEAWMYDSLLQGIDFYGYYTSNFVLDSTDSCFAIRVGSGYFGCDDCSIASSQVRPVITISKYNIK
ncbi:MAG: prepilin-type N-terminal cleavage/methylation domain-containing protein [Bacilli bacterium]|nr:prepilin-type N-terminal cleavage/methylation domain-containing protein [Bacilli bacterium]